MFFLRRRRVFIGECDGQAVYYDQKTGEALAAPKSRLLNTEKAGDTNSFIPDLVILLLAGGPAISGFFSLKSSLHFSILVAAVFLLGCHT